MYVTYIYIYTHTLASLAHLLFSSNAFIVGQVFYSFIPTNILLCSSPSASFTIFSIFFFIKNHETNLPSDKRIKSTTPIRDIRTKCEVSEWDSYLSHFHSPTRQTLWAGIHFCEHDVTIVIILIKFSF